MKRMLTTILLVALMTGAANAACYADYKAKKDAPLRLHYGVIEVSEAACGDSARAKREVSERVSRSGWTLLNVMSVFDASGLQQRKQSAAEYFLRF
jgi:predicted dinucleotide-binding enzyme